MNTARLAVATSGFCGTLLFMRTFILLLIFVLSNQLLYADSKRVTPDITAKCEKDGTLRFKVEDYEEQTLAMEVAVCEDAKEQLQSATNGVLPKELCACYYRLATPYVKCLEIDERGKLLEVLNHEVNEVKSRLFDPNIEVKYRKPLKCLELLRIITEYGRMYPLERKTFKELAKEKRKPTPKTARPRQIFEDKGSAH